MLKAYASAAGWETPTELPSLDTQALKDRAFLAPDLPGFNHGTIRITLLAVTAGAKETGSQGSIVKATSLSALRTATGGQQHHRCIIYMYIYVYCYQQGADDIKDREFCCMDGSQAVLRQSLRTGVAPVLPLSSYSVYKNRQGSVSQAKIGTRGPANVGTWQIWRVW